MTDEWKNKLINFRESYFPVLEVESRSSNIVNGVAASYYGVSNVGSALHRSKYENGGDFPDFLLRLTLKAFRKTFGNTRFDWVLYVPPTHSGDLVKNFAVKFASVIKVPISHKLVKSRQTSEQKVFQNSYLKQENVKDAFSYLSPEEINDFNLKWISLCRDKLKDNGTIWISGTYHNIFSVAQMLNELGFRILNCITWAKTNPPPNISCRYFTYSTEFIIWARKSAKVPHYYNYELMKHINEDKQMTDVWRLPAIASWEKSCGKHPTQKPLGLLTRIILASTQAGAWVLDPFAGSSTTGIAANLLGRRFLGIEREENFAVISKARREEIENLRTFASYKRKIPDIVKAESIQMDNFMCSEVTEELPFLFDPEETVHVHASKKYMVSQKRSRRK